MRKIILLVVFGCLLSVNAAFAQSKTVAKADKLYKSKNYSEAAVLYEAALAEKESLSVKTKLANCYRVNNRMDKAEKLYADITAADRAKAKTFLYYGEALMSNGKYEAAKAQFLIYQKEEPDDEQVQLLISACDYVKNIQPYFAGTVVSDFPHNSDADDSTPVMWNDKLVFSSDRAKGKTQKSGWTGRNFINLFYSEKNDTSFTEPAVFSGKLSDSNKNTGNPSFTADGERIYFTRNGVELSKRNVYNLSLFTAENSGGNRWKNVEILPFSSKEYNFMHPAVSPDGKELYFISDKPKGQGGTDIWVTRLSEKGRSRTQNLGYLVNTAANEGYPYVDAEGRLYFCSKGHPGYGGFDIFVTEKDADGEWQTPVNLGAPINSPRDDISIFIDKKQKNGLFTSNRSGGDDDIYLFATTGKNTAPPLPIKTETEEIAAPLPIKQTEKSKITPEAAEVAAEKAEPVTAVKPEEIVEPAPEIKFDSTLLAAEIAPEEIAAEEKIITITEEKIDSVIVENAPSAAEVLQPKKEPESVNSEIDLNKEIAEDAEPAPSYNLPENKTEIEEIPLTAPDFRLEKMPADSVKIIHEENLAAVAVPETLQTVAEPEPPFYYLNELSVKLSEKELKTGQIYRLENVRYPFEVYEVTPQVAALLDKVAVFLTENESVKAEIGAHTESTGNDKNNLILSRYRAQAAAAYLKKKGIAKDRLTYKGYGETEILNRCTNEVHCTGEEHVFNQRLEMKITEM